MRLSQSEFCFQSPRGAYPPFSGVGVPSVWATLAALCFLADGMIESRRLVWVRLFRMFWNTALRGFLDSFDLFILC